MKRIKPERKGIEKIEVDTMNIIEGSTGKELWGFASKKDIEKIIRQLGELVDAFNDKGGK